MDRVVRAHREGTKWKACIMIPLLPGFPLTIDHSDAGAVRHEASMTFVIAIRITIIFHQVRIILECQNRTISRGPDSLFARIRKEGIDVSILKV